MDIFQNVCLKDETRIWSANNDELRRKVQIFEVAASKYWRLSIIVKGAPCAFDTYQLATGQWLQAHLCG